MDRISRDAVAYPEQFGRHTGSAAARPLPSPEEPSLARTIVRAVVIATVVVLVITLVLVAATTNAATVEVATISAAAVPLSIVREVV
jgi:hypothetical protein